MPRISTEDKIKQLESRIASIRARADRQQVRANPVVKHMKAALKALEKSMAATDDQVMRKPLDEARGAVSACLGLCGVSAKGTRGTLTPRPRASEGPRATTAATAATRSPAALDAKSLAGYVRNNPGAKSEQISAAFGTDAATLRGAMRELLDEGTVRTEGQKRGTRYFVGA